jgi:uncharacterized protein
LNGRWGPAIRRLTREDVDFAVAGGSILAGGGGGWVEHGRLLGELAMSLRPPMLASADEVASDGFVVTASLVGANSSPTAYLEPAHYLRAVELLRDRFDGRLVGFVSSENGSSTSLNGWLQASHFDIPVIDAPCNGRAHPTGKMGSLGLGDDYFAIQAGVGGNPDVGSYVEVVASGRIAPASGVIRSAAVQAGGVVGVARNPVTADELRRRAAVGALSFALELGRHVLSARPRDGALGAVNAAAEYLHGEQVLEGTVVEVERDAVGGFDVGTVSIASADFMIEISGYMEYVLAERDGERIATFPDLIALFDKSNGDIVSFADVESGLQVFILIVSREHLPLGAGVLIPEYFRDLEVATGKELVSYVFTPR